MQGAPLYLDYPEKFSGSKCSSLFCSNEEKNDKIVTCSFPFRSQTRRSFRLGLKMIELSFNCLEVKEKKLEYISEKVNVIS